MSLNLGGPGVNQTLLSAMEELSRQTDLNPLNWLLQTVWKPLQVDPRRMNLRDKCSNISVRSNLCLW